MARQEQAFRITTTVAKVKDPEQYVILRFKQANPKKNSNFECIDFVGMTKRDIDDALKLWGSATAAKRGTNLATFGGHGNGGKFYMRQMFARSRMFTYREGKLNVFGFDEKGRYGYASGFENMRVPLSRAMEIADINALNMCGDYPSGSSGHLCLGYRRPSSRRSAG